MPRKKDRFSKKLVRGPTVFGTFLDEKGLTYAQAAEAIHCSRQYVGMIATAQRNITLDLALRISKWAQSVGGSVPVDSWPNLRAAAIELAKVEPG